MIADFDNDGNLDMLLKYTTNDSLQYFCIEWSDGSITEMTEFMNIDCASFESSMYDIDNNGYLDLFVNGKTSKDRENMAYMICFFPDRKYTYDKTNTYHWYYTKNMQTLRLANEKLLMSCNGSQAFSVNPTNTVPSAPTNLVFSQTPNGVTLGWQHSQDAETPSIRMRYNISVKRKGAKGDNAYLISPLNCDKNGVSIPSDKMLVTGNNFFIPISSIPTGTYELRVQGVDLMWQQSDFSAPLEFTVAQTCEASMPTSGVVNEPVKITIHTNADVEINMGGDGEIISQKRYEAYVKWSEAGLKELTINGVKHTINIYDLPDATFKMPKYVNVLDNVKVSATNLAKGKWSVTNNSQDASDKVTITPVDSSNDVLFTFTAPGDYDVRFTVKDNSLTASEIKTVHVGESAAPEVSIVDIANGKFRIIWDTTNAPEEALSVNIYKESNIAGDFRLLDNCPLSDVQYVDILSTTQIKSEAYTLSYMLSYGESAKSPVHRPMHCMINKGIGGAWNLLWSKYEGRVIDSYRILRGTTEDNLEVIDEISGNQSSYSDINAPDGELYYAVETVISATTATRLASKVPSSVLSSVSNIVCTRDGIEAELAESIRIYSASGANIINGNDGTNLQLYANILPVKANFKSVNWTVLTGDDIVVIDNYGMLTAFGNGTATIRANAIDGSNVYADYEVIVTNIFRPIPVESIEVYPDKLSMSLGETATLNYKIFPEDATDMTVAWASSDESVATVNNYGCVTGVGLGEATITATCGSSTSYSHITVTKKSQQILWEQSFSDVKVGDVVELTATATSGLKVTYSAEGPATIDGKLLTLNAPGSVKLTASQPGNEEYLKAEDLHVYFEVLSSIDSIETDGDGQYNVYTLTGILVKSTTDINELRTLSSGFYIINGHPVLIK